MDELFGFGSIAFTLIAAWYAAGLLIALVNYHERTSLPMIEAWASKHLLPIVQRRLLNRLLPELRQSAELHRLCAVHEAGHVVVFLHLLPGEVQGVRADGFSWVDNTGGMVRINPHGIHVEQQYLDLIAGYYGGLVAEVLVLGRHSDGCRGDLKHAARYADLAHNLFAGGHREPPIDYTELGELGHVSQQLDHQRMAAVVQLLKQGHERALNILSGERPLLDAIVTALLEQGELSREELLELFEKHASKKKA